MEPVPESARLLDQLSKYDHGLPGLAALGDKVQELVPSCVGMSVTLLREQLTITLVSSSSPIADLDALQFLGDGPCLDAIADGEIRNSTEDDAVRQGWELFAQGRSMFGIASTLSIPLGRDGAVAGVNLYATRPDAFQGHVEPVVAVFDGSALDVVHDADLSFTSRLRAAAAPVRLADQDDVDLAIGVLAARLEVDVETAEQRLRDAAARADVSVVHLANIVNESSVR